LVARAARADFVPVVLGGDHSVALGTLAGLREVHGLGGAIWIDAHGDLNSPETSPSGNVHGMVLAAALGLAGDRFKVDGWGLPALAPGRVALVAVRALDEGERALLRELDARVYTMSDVDRLGVERVLRESLTHVAGPGFVHVSLDMDAVDPDVAPGVGTPVRGGLSYREAHLAMELIAESGLASSLDVVEVNPILDRENETGKLAVELVASALGARIL
jgi:arginase